MGGRSIYSICLNGSFLEFKKFAYDNKISISELLNLEMNKSSNVYYYILLYGNLELFKKVYKLYNGDKLKNEIVMLSYKLNYGIAAKLLLYFINKGVNLNQQDAKHGNSALMEIVLNFNILKTEKMIEILKVCLKKNGDFYLKNNNGLTPYDAVKRLGNKEVLEVINKHYEK